MWWKTRRPGSVPFSNVGRSKTDLFYNDLGPYKQRETAIHSSTMATKDEYKKDILRVATKALLTALEDPCHQVGSEEGQCQLLRQLFEPSKKGDFIAQHLTAKKQVSIILDVIRSANKGLLRRVFSGLYPIVEKIIAGDAYVPASAYEDHDDGENDHCRNKADVDKSAECMSLLKYAAMCTEAALDGRISKQKGNENNSTAFIQILPEVYDVALQLHNILLSLHDCGDEGLATRNAILSLCESWWLANIVHRNHLIAQVLPIQVIQASDPTEFQKSHIKKLHRFKDAFQVIDFLNPSSESLRSLLLRVASNPFCLKLPEGRRFLWSLFRDPDLVPELHLAFRAQIPNASKTILQAYAEIYYKAWCESEDSSEEETREVIEHMVLQDLMHAAIHVASPTMAKALLSILDPIHNDKKDKRVAELLSRLYSPILWRSLSVSNPLVRRNAVSVLGQVFPLHDPNQNNMRSSIEKCSSALKNALQDSDPRVRIAASEATANICVLFWEALPSADIRMLLNRK